MSHGQHNPYQTPPTGYGAPHGYNPPPGAPPPSYHHSHHPPATYTGATHPPATFTGAGHTHPAGTNPSVYNPSAYNPAAPPQQVAYGAYSPQHTAHQPHTGGAYGAPPPATSPYPPPATNLYATEHTGASGYFPAHHAPPAPPAPPAVSSCPPGVDPTLWQVFKVVDHDNNNNISASELQQALTNNNWTQFNSETCRMLIGQFDVNKDGSIDIYEFSHLWKYIQDWRQCFEGFDTDNSGTIDVNELQQAFQTFGYRLSVEFCRLCTRVFDRSDKNSMNFDSFIQCCVLLRSLTQSFKRRDTNQNGQINVSYEDFLEMVIDNTVTP